MRLDRRLSLLERHRRPMAERPEHITIVRGRHDNPKIPDDFFPCDIVFVDLDEHGNRCEERIPALEVQ